MLVICKYDESAVVANFVNVAAFSDFLSIKPSISAQISVHFVFFIAQMFAHIAYPNHDPNGVTCRVKRPKIFTCH